MVFTRFPGRIDSLTDGESWQQNDRRISVAEA